MVGRIHPVWARAAALGVMAAWLPCMPLGLCVRAAANPAASHGCHRQSPANKVSAAPQECWLQSPTPAPAGPPPPALAPPAVTTAHTRSVAESRTFPLSQPTAFSPLAIVLRI